MFGREWHLIKHSGRVRLEVWALREAGAPTVLVSAILPGLGESLNRGKDALGSVAAGAMAAASSDLEALRAACDLIRLPKLLGASA
jgi:hypothetical protein